MILFNQRMKLMEIINGNYQCINYLRYIDTCMGLTPMYYHKETDFFLTSVLSSIKKIPRVYLWDQKMLP